MIKQAGSSWTAKKSIAGVLWLFSVVALQGSYAVAPLPLAVLLLSFGFFAYSIAAILLSQEVPIMAFLTVVKFQLSFSAVAIAFYFVMRSASFAITTSYLALALIAVAGAFLMLKDRTKMCTDAWLLLFLPLFFGDFKQM